MAQFKATIIDTLSVQSGDLITAPNINGSDFNYNQKIDNGAMLNGLILNISGQAVASLNPTFRLYRKDPLNNIYYKANAITLITPITTTGSISYVATEGIEVGAGDLAIVLEACELGATLRVDWLRYVKRS